METEYVRTGGSTCSNAKPSVGTIKFNVTREMWFTLLLGDVIYHIF